MSLTESLYMSIPIAYESPGKSFEEVRIEDYLQFYSTTGRPPPPCPQQPADPAARARAGLPPLFKPQSESKLTPSAPSTSTTSTNSATPSSAQITDPASLPPAQVFVSTRSEGDSLQSISAMGIFSAFSHEELRIYAYLLGNKVSPTPINMSPFVVAPPLPAPTSSTTTSTATPSSNNGLPPIPPGEQMQTLSANAPFSKHSLEEHRIAYLHFRVPRDLTSDEIASGSILPALNPLSSLSSALPPLTNPTPTSNISPFSPITPLAPTQSQSPFSFGASNPSVNPFSNLGGSSTNTNATSTNTNTNTRLFRF